MSMRAESKGHTTKEIVARWLGDSFVVILTMPEESPIQGKETSYWRWQVGGAQARNMWESIPGEALKSEFREGDMVKALPEAWNLLVEGNAALPKVGGDAKGNYWNGFAQNVYISFSNQRVDIERAPAFNPAEWIVKPEATAKMKRFNAWEAAEAKKEKAAAAKKRAKAPVKS